MPWGPGAGLIPLTSPVLIAKLAFEGGTVSPCLIGLCGGFLQKTDSPFFRRGGKDVAPAVEGDNPRVAEQPCHFQELPQVLTEGAGCPVGL